MKKSASRLDLLNKDHRLRKILLLSLKIGVGSSLAIYLARRMALDYAVSAGTIMLLTVMTSKWESLRLAWLRTVNLSADSGFSVGDALPGSKVRGLHMGYCWQRLSVLRNVPVGDQPYP